MSDEDDNAYDDGDYDEYDTYGRESDIEDFDEEEEDEEDYSSDDDEEEEEDEDKEEDDEDAQYDDDDDDDDDEGGDYRVFGDGDADANANAKSAPRKRKVGKSACVFHTMVPADPIPRSRLHDTHHFQISVVVPNEYDENGMLVEKVKPLHKVLTTLHLKKHGVELETTAKGKELSQRIATRLELLKRDPNNSTIKMSLARQYIALEKWDTAILILEEILSENNADSLETGAATWKMLTRSYMNSARLAERSNDLHRWTERLGHCSNAYHSALIELDYVEDLAAHMCWSRWVWPLLPLERSLSSPPATHPTSLLSPPARQERS